MFSIFPKMDALTFKTEKCKSSADFDSDIEDEESTIDSNKSRNLKRRSMILEKLQQTKKDRTRNDTRSDLSTVMKTEEEAAAEYKNTMELFMKNKINEKNVYKLNLNLAATLYKKSNELEKLSLNKLTDFCRKKVDFAEAATALDGATKIWCYKVDAIYTEACQITKGIEILICFPNFPDIDFFIKIKFFQIWSMRKKLKLTQMTAILEILKMYHQRRSRRRKRDSSFSTR